MPVSAYFIILNFLITAFSLESVECCFQTLQCKFITVNLKMSMHIGAFHMAYYHTLLMRFLQRHYVALLFTVYLHLIA